LLRDPLFAGDAAEFGVSADELDRRMAQPPGHLDGEALWDWLDGADQYRWAGLRVLAEALAGTVPVRLPGNVTVPGQQAWIATGDVLVDGNLVLGEQAMVLVLGRLTVAGALVGSLSDYSMVAAAEVACRNGVTAGEVLALSAIRCPGAFYLSHNDYSCRAPLYSGGVLVDFERFNAFSRVEVDERLTDWDFAAAAHALGVPADDELPRAYAARLLST